MHTDKPRTLALKDYIIRRLSPQLMLSEDTINTVISHQYASANEALNHHNEIEISGLGKFMFASKRASYKLEAIKHLLEETLSLKQADEQKLRENYYNKKIATYTDMINYVEKKLNKTNG